MALYCGIDLHSNNHVVTVIDEQDRRRYEKRAPPNKDRRFIVARLDGEFRRAC